MKSKQWKQINNAFTFFKMVGIGDYAKNKYLKK